MTMRKVMTMVTMGVTLMGCPQVAPAHDHYKHWLQPGTNISCCDEKKTVDGKTTGDCYPTQARLVRGSWVALRDDGVCVDIPDDLILRERNPGSEDAHLCFNYGRVLCFVPPDTGG